jgi:hypothetical protein
MLCRYNEEVTGNGRGSLFDIRYLADVHGVLTVTNTVLERLTREVSGDNAS